jgi:hypothetical protein
MEAPAPGTRAFAKKGKIEYVDLPQRKWDMYTSPPTNYVQLLSAIRFAPSLARLRELARPEMLQRYDAVHVSAALTKLPKLVHYREKDLVRSDVVLPKGTGVLAVRPAAGAAPRQQQAAEATALARLLLGMLPDHAHRLFPRQAANCIWALGRMHSMGLPVVQPPAPKRPSAPTPAAPAASPALSPAGKEGEELREQDREEREDPNSLAQVEARLAGAGMDARFTRAFLCLLEVCCERGFAQLNAHAQPAEVVQLLKGMTQLPRGCQHHALAQALMYYVAERAPRFKVGFLGRGQKVGIFWCVCVCVCV